MIDLQKYNIICSTIKSNIKFGENILVIIMNILILLRMILTKPAFHFLV